MKNHRTNLSQRVRYALLAGMAGAFLIPQVAFAAPTGEHDYTTGVNVDRNTANTTKITSTATNNVINWRDYSVNQGETVQYDGGVTGAAAHNYLNIVTGANTSNINGTIKGGNEVYIVNPNGVIFGKSAEVNVGHLYVSTQEEGTLNLSAFKATGSSHASPLVDTAPLKADVVNMGKITADTVEVHGKNIRFLNAANVHTTASPVVLHTDTANGGYAHIGYKEADGQPAVTDYKINNNNATAADNYYQLVADKTEFQNINSDRTKNYMLENDIDFSGTALTPIGDDTTKFTGKLDGNFFQVKNFKVSGGSRAGLFGTTSGARLENFGVVGAEITGNTGVSDYAGGIAAYSEGGTQIRNVYVKDTVVDGGTGQHGGIVGGTENTTLDGVYSKATIGDGGGIIGTSATGTNIYNTYSDASFLSRIPPTQRMFFIYMIDPDNGTYVENSFAMGQFSYNEGNLTGNVSKNTFKINKSSGQATLVGSGTGGGSMTSVASYSGWGNAINNTGAPGATWRIYEGRTTPMLTAFMSGTATATYNYRYFKSDGTLKDDTGNTVKSNDGKDITAEYNSYYMKVVDGSTANPTAAGTKANVSFGAGVDTSHVIDYVNSSTKDYDRTNGIRNVGTKAILWTDQDGPNLRGVNVTIKPRVVSLDNGSLSPSRMYNGKSDVTKTFREALKNGGIGSSGFTAEDIANGSVALDFTTGNFKAWTVDNSNNPDKNVGKDKNVKFSGTIGFSGADAGNYTFDGSSLSNLTGKATITKAPLYLAIAKKRADEKIYDGTSVVKDAAMLQSGSTPNITLDKSKTGLTLAQIDAGTPAMPDGAIMTGDDDTTRDNVSLTTVGGPKYTDEHGVEQLHAGSHKLQYTNVGLTGNDAGNYELYYTPESGTKTAVTGGNVYLDGKIIPRQILRDDFNIYDKTTHAKVDAKKVYDGNDEYTPTSDVYLSSNAVTGGTTGLVERDRNHITFALTGGKGHFTQADGTTSTKNVSNAAKVAYTVTGQTDDATNYRLSDYYIMDGTTKKDLGSTFHATGAGKITPKALTATVVNQHITKVYDAMDDQTDGKRHIIKGDDLVTLSGWVAGDTARTNTSTAKYADKNVAVDGLGNPTTKSVTYTASFDAGSGDEAQNYTLGAEGALPIETTKTLTGGYTGTITTRNVTVKFADVTKVYDGTVTNTQITASDLDDGLNKDVLNADSLGVGNLNTTGVTSRYGDNKTATTFAENRNAGSRTVEYAGLTNALGTNYKLDAKQYGDGTITRRRIDPSGFKVRKSDGTLADATKVYDGTDTYNLPSGAYLTGSSASGDTGIVSHDFGKVVFELKTNSPGHFTKDAAGANRTSHKSEATYVAYDVKAKTLDPTNNPLSNYTFGVAGSPRNLETVTDANPAQVTAEGSITPASLRAATQEISKVYDGLTAHTDGNRNVVKGDTVVGFTGWVVHNGTTEKRTNSSTAEYATKDVAYDGSGNVIKKSVTYTGQLTGQYADDYQIVDAGNHVISTPNGSGATKTVTMNAPITVANAGTITPRKLNIKMGDVSKTYDGTAGNTSATVTGFTDDPASSVLAAVLGVDNVTATRLTNRYQGMVSPANTTTTSTYGRGNTDATFGENVNASNGTPHDVQYTNMRNAFKDEFGSTTAGNYTVDDTVYGKGTINRREITPNNFQVKDANGNVANATKVYDGTTKYTLENGWHLTPAVGPGTGVIPADYSKVVFRLNGDAQFADSSDNPTANVASATKVLYNVKAEGDAEKIKNYTLNGVNLESGVAKVSGGGSITRRVLELDLVQNSGIDKVYDGTTTLKNTATKNWNALRDSDSTGNVRYVTGATAKDKLVTTDGTSFNITSNYMESGSADKNVKRSGGNIVDKDILYKVAINGDATNYSFKKGGSVTDAESGLELSATGKITPKDLSGAFKKVTKVYDGTKNVDPTKVGFKTGTDGVISGDTVTLNSHAETFQSENVNGDGTTQMIDGTPQKNWINYSNLQLGGADAGNYKISSTAEGLGEITPLALDADKFKVDGIDAEKTYDGNSSYQLPSGKKLAPSGIGLIGTDATHIEFEMKSGTFTDNGGTATPNVYEATRISYQVKAKAGSGYERLLGNYTLNGKTLDSGTVEASGKGEITRREIKLKLDQTTGIDKAYDGTSMLKDSTKKWNTLKTASETTGNVLYETGSNELVAGAQFEIKSNYRNDTNTDAGKDVRGTSAAPQVKDILYEIRITNGDARNYSFKKGSVLSNAEAGLKLEAVGTITPKNLTNAFARIPDKVYDGNTNVDSSKVRFVTGAVISGDDVQLATHNESYQSKNVNGDGSSWTPIEGEERGVIQKNWVNYSNLTLGGAGKENYIIAPTARGLGSITPLNINGNVEFTTSTTPAEKVYDGTRILDPGVAKQYITSATVNGTTLNLDDFAVESAVYQSTEVNNEAQQDVYYNMKINDTVGNLIVSGKLKQAQGKGIIKRRILSLDLVQKTGIDKTYDGTATLTDGTKNWDALTETDTKGNVQYVTGSNKLVNDGTSFNIESNYMEGGTANKNVKRVAGNIADKNILYKITLNGNASNYSFKKNGVKTNAELGLELSATGKITPKDLSGAFEKVTKVYDGNTSVDHTSNSTVTPAQVGFKTGAVISGDAVNLVTHNESFQSANVNGDGTTKVIDGTEQKNWINYSNLTLGGTDAGNYKISSTAEGLGEIKPLALDADKFKVDGIDAEKTYDGSSAYHLEAGKKLAPHAGLIGTDANNIEFEMDGDGTFTDDNGTAKANTFDATRVSYKVKAKTGSGNERLLGNYMLNGKTLDSGTIGVSGKGTITRRTLNLDLVQKTGIDKTYDGTATLTDGTKNWNALTETDTKGNIQYVTGSNKLVNDGTSFKIESNYMEGGTANKNVKRVAGNIADKDILYKITLNGNASNYSFKKGGAPATNAELGLELSATGKIEPKDLSGSFEKVTKPYDGTTAVAPNAVHFEKGSVIGDDDVDILRTGTDAYTAEFESPNVDGSGTTWIAPDGTVQNNWVNYGNLKLTGAQAGNYQISPTARGVGEITPLPPEPEFYIPDADYYNTLAANKMLPDEYAYENASLDRRSHFGRDAEAEIAYEPPSINIVQDGIDLSKSNIVVTDKAVFEIVNEVFG